MKYQNPLSFRLEPELHERLEKCSKELKLKKYSLGLMAIEAAVEAIEKNDYRLVVPIRFSVSHVPSSAKATYPEHRAQYETTSDKTAAEEKGKQLAQDTKNIAYIKTVSSAPASAAPAGTSTPPPDNEPPAEAPEARSEPPPPSGSKVTYSSGAKRKRKSSGSKS